MDIEQTEQLGCFASCIGYSTPQAIHAATRSANEAALETGKFLLGGERV